MKKSENEKNERKRKNYPGEVREVGTKDYSLIMGNLINYKHKLSTEAHSQKAGVLMRKIATKIKELGYEKASEMVKDKVGRRKEGKFQNITEKKRLDTVDIAEKIWKKAKEKHEKAKEKRKEKDRD